MRNKGAPWHHASFRLRLRVAQQRTKEAKRSSKSVDGLPVVTGVAIVAFDYVWRSYAKTTS
jgi:hypothetical protein